MGLGRWAYRARKSLKRTRKGYGRTMRHVGGLARQAYKLAKRALPELHLFDNVLDLDTLSNHNTAVGSTSDNQLYTDVGAREAMVHRLAKIAEGDGPDNRTGQTVDYKALYGRAHMKLASGTAAIVRVMIVADTEPEGSTLPTLGSLLQIPSGSSVPRTTSFRKLDGNRNRYRIMYDRTRELNTDSPRAICKWNFPRLHRGRTAFDVNNRAKSGIDYFLVVITDAAPGNVEFQLNHRMRFYP